MLPISILSAIYSSFLAFALSTVTFGQYRLLVAAGGSWRPWGGLTPPLALMMTLRANASLDRINEARLLWGGGCLACADHVDADEVLRPPLMAL